MRTSQEAGYRIPDFEMMRSQMYTLQPKLMPLYLLLRSGSMFEFKGGMVIFDEIMYGVRGYMISTVSVFVKRSNCQNNQYFFTA
jgi:hypothetical protein